MKQYKLYKDLGEVNIPNRNPQPQMPQQKIFDQRTMSLKQSQQSIPNQNSSNLYGRELYSPPDNKMNAIVSENNNTTSIPSVTSEATVHIQSGDHKDSIIKNNRIAVIDVWGSFCAPCKTIAPAYEELAKKYRRDGICMLAKEDIALGLSKDVRGVPTFFIYKDGQVVDKVVGADLTSEDGVEQKLLNVIQSL